MSTTMNHEVTLDTISPDSSGQAAMLLVESLIHGLVEQSLITVSVAVDIVDTAVEVAAEAQDNPEDPSTRRPSAVAALTLLRQSLRFDLPAA